MDVEKVWLEDGRKAERRVVRDDQGERVEIWAEEPRKMILEKRITREHKNVLAKEVVETIQDGVTVAMEVKSLEEPELETRQRVRFHDELEPEPVFKAMSIVEANVAEKPSGVSVVQILLLAIAAQVTFLLVYFFAF